MREELPGLVLAFAMMFGVYWWGVAPIGFGAWAPPAGGGERVWIPHSLVMSREACEGTIGGPTRFVVSGAMFERFYEFEGARCEPVSKAQYYATLAADCAMQALNWARGRPRCAGAPMCV